MKLYRLSPRLLSLLVILLAAAPAQAQENVIISEFMPANTRTLADEDLDFPDWIELFNGGQTAVNLAGWRLTDDPAAPAKWSFPSVTVPPGGFLVVFASGKNRTNNPARLHTNFQLDFGGGYLALFQPDGITAASAYQYAKVKDDVSFGLAQQAQTTSLLAASKPVVLVPASAAQLPAAWNQRGFNPDGLWLAGVAPPSIGFDTNQLTGLPSNVAPTGAAAESTVNASFTADLAINNNLTDFTHTLGTDPAPFWQVTLPAQKAIYSVLLLNRVGCCGSRLRDITLEILATNSTGTVTNFSSVLLNPENAGYTYPNGPVGLTNDLVALTGGPADDDCDAAGQHGGVC